MTCNQRGDATIIVVLVVALAGLGVFLFNPRSIHGESQRADASAKATSDLNAATNELLKAEKSRSAEAAASVVKIGEANAGAPESPEKSFIAREVPVALANLAPPDQMALIEAERRKAAVLEGRLEEASRLYRDAYAQAAALQRERDLANAALEQARIDRQKADQAILEAAAAHRAMQKQRNLFIVGVVVAGALWMWVKFTHFSPRQMADSVRDIRSKTYADPVEAIDVAANRLQQKIVRWFM